MQVEEEDQNKGVDGKAILSFGYRQGHVSMTQDGHREKMKPCTLVKFVCYFLF